MIQAFTIKESHAVWANPGGLYPRGLGRRNPRGPSTHTKGCSPKPKITIPNMDTLDALYLDSKYGSFQKQPQIDPNILWSLLWGLPKRAPHLWKPSHAHLLYPILWHFEPSGKRFQTSWTVLGTSSEQPPRATKSPWFRNLPLSVPLLTALWSLFDGSWCLLKGSCGVLEIITIRTPVI